MPPNGTCDDLLGTRSISRIQHPVVPVGLERANTPASSPASTPLVLGAVFCWSAVRQLALAQAGPLPCL